MEDNSKSGGISNNYRIFKGLETLLFNWAHVYFYCIIIIEGGVVSSYGENKRSNYAGSF